LCHSYVLIFFFGVKKLTPGVDGALKQHLEVMGTGRMPFLSSVPDSGYG